MLLDDHRFMSIFLIGTCLAVTILLIFFFPPSICHAFESLPPDNVKYLKIKAIYNDISRSFGDGRTPPRLVVTPAGSVSSKVVAWSDPGNTASFGINSTSSTLNEGYIAIDEKVYDLFDALGVDRNNAIAFLLGHELAHFYLRHGWVNDFGNAFASLDVGKKMMRMASHDEIIKCEAEADYFGGFYGYLAGYDTLGLAPRVLDMIYAAYRLPDRIPNYPARMERKEIARTTECNLRKIAPVFEAANRLMLLEKYKEAAQLFEYLTQTFPSREMFNNAGVAYTLEALRLFGPSETRFAYPFEFDAETRLYSRPSRIKGARSVIERKQLLEAASERLEKALQRDKKYATALVNLAAVYDLAGDKDSAMFYANRGMEAARKGGDTQSMANALVVRGIIISRGNRIEEAMADFREARSMNNRVADINISVLQGRLVPDFSKELKSAVPGEERIGGVAVGSTFVKDKDVMSFFLAADEKGNSDITIHSKLRGDYDDILIIIGGKYIRSLGTRTGYKGESLRGIRIGSQLNDLRKLYGNPRREAASRQARYWIYESPDMIFSLDRDEKVTGWMVLFKEK
jgi:tetratricopeptide (TPR) repeat protein